ncbi:MAG: Mini-ribonuclease 3 [Christensenellales bacterium]
MHDLRTRIAAQYDAKIAEADRLNPLVLAYVGDAVFELYVRTMLIDAHDAKAHALHRMSADRVRASAQAKAAKGIFAELTEQESAVFTRARNAKPHTMPKNAQPEEYSHATALEAVIGYAYLSGDEERALYLMKRALEIEAVVDTAIPRPYKG